MIEFKVIEIIDADTIKVDPGWKLTTPNSTNPSTGNEVRIAGYRSVLRGSSEYSETVSKLNFLLKNQKVTLRQAALINDAEIAYNLISARVFLNEVDITEYFPELKLRKPGFSQ